MVTVCWWAALKTVPVLSPYHEQGLRVSAQLGWTSSLLSLDFPPVKQEEEYLPPSRCWEEWCNAPSSRPDNDYPCAFVSFPLTLLCILSSQFYITYHGFFSVLISTLLLDTQSLSLTVPMQCAQLPGYFFKMQMQGGVGEAGVSASQDSDSIYLSGCGPENPQLSSRTPSSAKWGLCRGPHLEKPMIWEKLASEALELHFLQIQTWTKTTNLF